MVLIKLMNFSKKTLLVLINIFLIFCISNAQHSYLKEEKIKVLNQVMNQLIMSTGHIINEPKIQLTNSEHNVASYSSSNTIKIENKAYQICQSFGKDSLNAMAFLIAHELSHKINKDYNSLKNCSFYLESSFINNDSSSILLKETINNQRRIEVEATADQDACLYTQISGYNSIPIVPELLHRIYSKYNFGDGDSMKNYPSLKQRIKISSNAIKKNKDLAILFNLSNTIFLFGEYDYSITIFEQLIEKFPSREMFTNLGSCYASKAIQLINKVSKTLIYPFEMDNKSRLKNKESNRGFLTENDVNNELIIDYLNKANKNFIKATRIDETYFKPLLYISLLENVMGNNYNSNYYLKKSEKYLKTKNDTNLYEISKIILNFDLKKDTNKVLKKLELINHPIANKNIQILSPKKKTDATIKILNFSKPVNINPWYNYDSSINLSNLRLEYSTNKIYNHFRIEDLILTKVKELDNHIVNGIKKDYNYNKIINIVGEPDSKIENYDETYLIYLKSNLIMTLDNDEFKSYYYFEKL
jgi:hypothetical protein